MYDLTLNRVTPSMLATFEKCPMSFFYSYYLGIKMPQQTMHFHFGTGIHEAIDIMFGQHKNWPDEKILETAKLKFHEFFTDTSVNEVGIDSVQKQREKYQDMRRDGLELLDAVWLKKEWLVAEGVLPKIFEQPMKFKPWHPETKEELEVPLSLRIDGLNHEDRTIYEYKTSASKYNPEETRVLPQTLAYVWAIWCDTGIVYDVVYLILLKNRKRERLQVLRYQYDLADIVEFDARVRAILEKIKLRDFNFTTPCKAYWCDCKKYKKALDVNHI